MLVTLLQTAEEQGHVKLVRDANGTITGGRYIEAVPGAGALQLPGHAPVLKVGPAALDGAGLLGARESLQSEIDTVYRYMLRYKYGSP
jgi:hypothetical protein